MCDRIRNSHSYDVRPDTRFPQLRCATGYAIPTTNYSTGRSAGRNEHAPVLMHSSAGPAWEIMKGIGTAGGEMGKYGHIENEAPRAPPTKTIGIEGNAAPQALPGAKSARSQTRWVF
eukprot:gene7502-biopygen7560